MLLSSPTRSVRRFAVSALFVALAVVGDSLFAAPSETEPLRVELTAPEACPTRPTLFERVRSHTARIREAAEGEKARALRVAIAPDGGGFVAGLRLADDGEVLERRVPGKTCEEVLAAVALITALMIDPLASAVPTDAGGPETGAAPPPRVRPSPEPMLPAEIDAAEPPPPRARTRVSAGVSLEAYGLGELVFGRSIWIEGALAMRASPALRLRLARTQSFTEERDRRPAFFQLTTVGLDGCLTALRSRPELDQERSTLELRPCAQVAGGVIEGSSSAFGSVNRIPRPWLSLGAMLQGRWRFLGPLELEAALGLSIPFIRDNFFFLPQIDVYRAPGAVLLGNVGVGTTFR